MTSKLTRERLAKIKSWRETYGAGSNVMLPAEEAEELARIALAAMAGEPVAYIPESQLNLLERAVMVEADLSKVQRFDEIPLYRHAQQPVVPDDVLDALQKVARIRLDMNDFDGDRRGIADCLGDAEEALIEVVNRCAAMLAAAPQSPGSEPATVPGKWIPVSERMPEAGGDMIVFADGIVMSGVSYAKKKGFYIQALEYDDDEPVDSVTHWMPLPAAPQEVSDA